jgi:23S rRNA (guanosine2251-2'-O)-methyltransferase
MRKLSHAELVERQVAQSPKTLPFCAILNNIRSLYNVGSIFRTADGAGLEKLWICGVTGIPPDTKISKTALGAEKSVPWEYVRHAKTCAENLKARGYQIILLEQTEKSIPFDEFKPEGPVCLIVGNEISGVSDELLPYCDAAVEIEMAGLKNSLNVTVAFGIMAYQLRKQLLNAGSQARRSAIKNN